MASWLWIVITVLDIVALISTWTDHTGIGHKVLWTILILILPVIGMILYYIVGRRTAHAR